MSVVLEPIEPTALDAQKAAKAIAQLATGHLELAILPDIAVKIISQVLNTLAEGHGLVMLTSDSDLTPNQAASHLNVSRPYLLGLLKQGEIPFHYVGTHRRIRLRDVVAYRDKVDEESEKTLLELAAQAQELRMGYPAAV